MTDILWRCAPTLVRRIHSLAGSCIGMHFRTWTRVDMSATSNFAYGLRQWKSGFGLLTYCTHDSKMAAVRHVRFLKIQILIVKPPCQTAATKKARLDCWTDWQYCHQTTPGVQIPAACNRDRTCGANCRTLFRTNRLYQLTNTKCRLVIIIKILTKSYDHKK